ncbi:hypothetical protein [Pseudohongiella spirulinae]|uniref:Uncharacterized protein n=1 Tax=Pseudohongiella spirulinae TaxID=1249552 RepID=A0A0S2KAM8_9GAMM|nr:hypothetical protein [Pseudohongiella spirulinae]ALO45026.1 hypothetical protein PS2015_336 [Pseudohongiella spirulinae]
MSARIGQRADYWQSAVQPGKPEQQNNAELLLAAERVSRMAKWLVINMTYARNVHLDGRPLTATDLKGRPAGNTSAALRYVPLYVGYLLANALSGKTRAWLMSCDAGSVAVDAVNVLIGNADESQLSCYSMSDEGLSRLCRDYFSDEVTLPESVHAANGSALRPHSAAALASGVHAGNTARQFVHMPLPGQELVVFLDQHDLGSQPGTDWGAYWWRGEDSGLVMPLLQVGDDFAAATALLNEQGFNPVLVDGDDPIAIARVIIELGENLQEQHRRVITGEINYPVRMPLAVIHFSPSFELPETSSLRVNEILQPLHVPVALLEQAADMLNCHARQRRTAAKDHWLCQLQVSQPELPYFAPLEPFDRRAPIDIIDDWICHLVEQNPFHRFRIVHTGYCTPCLMPQSLTLLNVRTSSDEPDRAGSRNGAVIVAANEESAVAAALANKQGINLVLAQEAAGISLYRSLRREAVFAREQSACGCQTNWIAVPILITAHVWDNSRSGLCQQSPALTEAWLEEMSDVAPVYFPVDAETAVAVTEFVYSQRARVALVVLPGSAVPLVTNTEQAMLAAARGITVISQDDDPEFQLIAIGAYQLAQVQRAAVRLRERGYRCSVISILEPGRFRVARDERESDYIYDTDTLKFLIPDTSIRLLVTHVHGDIAAGLLRRLADGAEHFHVMGYCNQGGTLDVFGLLYANHQTWAHVLQQCALARNLDMADLLNDAELQAVTGRGDPAVLR